MTPSEFQFIGSLLRPANLLEIKTTESSLGHFPLEVYVTTFGSSV